eukprot:6212320-Pleurochrysis_carterae.AAC.1
MFVLRVLGHVCASLRQARFRKMGAMKVAAFLSLLELGREWRALPKPAALHVRAMEFCRKARGRKEHN